MDLLGPNTEPWVSGQHASVSDARTKLLRDAMYDDNDKPITTDVDATSVDEHATVDEAAVMDAEAAVANILIPEMLAQQQALQAAEAARAADLDMREQRQARIVQYSTGLLLDALGLEYTPNDEGSDE